MNRVYSRREILQAKRDRQAVRDMIKQVFTILVVGFGLVLFCATALVLAYAVGTTL